MGWGSLVHSFLHSFIHFWRQVRTTRVNTSGLHRALDLSTDVSDGHAEADTVPWLVWKLRDAPATTSQDPASQRPALAGTSPAEADGQEGAKWPAPTLLRLRPDQASAPGAGSRCSVESEDPGVAPGTRSAGGWGGCGAEETRGPMTSRSAGCLPLGLVRTQLPDQALACRCGQMAPCSLRAARGSVGSLSPPGGGGLEGKPDSGKDTQTQMSSV